VHRDKKRSAFQPPQPQRNKKKIPEQNTKKQLPVTKGGGKEKPGSFPPVIQVQRRDGLTAKNGGWRPFGHRQAAGSRIARGTRVHHTESGEIHRTTRKKRTGEEKRVSARDKDKGGLTFAEVITAAGREKEG